MMSKTHFSIGMATALAATVFVTPKECTIALIGGAIGGVFADVDTIINDYKHDALIGELLSLGVMAIVSVLDYFFKWGLINYIINHYILAIIGGVAFITLYIIGLFQEHRGFTHSIFAMLLVSACFLLINPLLGFTCLAGYASHLILDIMNKKGIRLFFPAKKEICFNWCYASKTANAIFMWIGFISTIALIIYSVFKINNIIM